MKANTGMLATWKSRRGGREGYLSCSSAYTVSMLPLLAKMSSSLCDIVQKCKLQCSCNLANFTSGSFSSSLSSPSWFSFSSTPLPPCRSISWVRSVLVSLWTQLGQPSLHLSIQSAQLFWNEPTAYKLKVVLRLLLQIHSLIQSKLWISVEFVKQGSL